MGRRMGIDFGTSYIRIFAEPDGIVLRAPSVVALDKRTREVIATGGDAKRMLGKTPSGILAYRPIKESTVAEFDAAARMLELFLHKLKAVSFFSHPKILLSAPLQITEVGQMALENVALEAGARSVAVVEAPLAAAVGAGLRVNAARGCMLMDFGGGMTEMAVISSGGIVCSNSSRACGDRIDTVIQNYLRLRRNILVGESTAEYIKRELATALPGINRGSMRVSGLHVRTGLACTVTVTGGEIFEAIRGMLNSLARSAVATIEQTPPDIAADIFDYGLLLTGGGSQIPGMAKFLSRAVGVRVVVAREPLDCVAVGLGKLLRTPRLISQEPKYRFR